MTTTTTAAGATRPSTRATWTHKGDKSSPTYIWPQHGRKHGARVDEQHIIIS